jgi:hypothetical protein
MQGMTERHSRTICVCHRRDGRALREGMGLECEQQAHSQESNSALELHHGIP